MFARIVAIWRVGTASPSGRDRQFESPFLQRRDRGAPGLRGGARDPPRTRPSEPRGLPAVSNPRVGPAGPQLVSLPQQLRDFSAVKFSLSAIRAKSGSEAAFIFRMTWPRWTFTVISLMPMSYAICLLRRPATTKAITSRSRGVRVSKRVQLGGCFFLPQPRGDLAQGPAGSRPTGLDRGTAWSGTRSLRPLSPGRISGRGRCVRRRVFALAPCPPDFLPDRRCANTRDDRARTASAPVGFREAHSNRPDHGVS
jgi:hypothetical protein